jgi:hypothetical protein
MLGFLENEPLLERLRVLERDGKGCHPLARTSRCVFCNFFRAGRKKLYAVIRKITTLGHCRDELERMLGEYFRHFGEDVLFLIGRDATSSDLLLVTELWSSRERESLARYTPAVQMILSRIETLIIESEVSFDGQGCISGAPSRQESN